MHADVDFQGSSRGEGLPTIPADIALRTAMAFWVARTIFDNNDQNSFFAWAEDGISLPIDERGLDRNLLTSLNKDPKLESGFDFDTVSWQVLKYVRIVGGGPWSPHTYLSRLPTAISRIPMA